VIGTPSSWRLAALAIVGVSLILGAAVAAYVPTIVLLVPAAILLAYIVPIAVSSRHVPLPPLDADALNALGVLPRVTVVVAARDEAGVIPDLLADLAEQDHRDATGRPNFEVIVIDDRSVDGTGEVARATAEACGLGTTLRVVRRGGAVGSPEDPGSAGAAEAWPAAGAPALPDGKGAALTAVDPADYASDIVIVLDADARIAPAFLRRAASYFARGARAMTARRRIMTARGRSWVASELAGAQDDEQTGDGEIQRGRWALRGCSEFRGNGIFIHRDLLQAVGGWHAQALCEDLDLSTRVAVLGERVGWALDAVVWEEPVVSLAPLWRQRMRWGTGIIRRELELTGALVRSPHLSAFAKLDYVGYSLQTILPVVLVGLLAGTVVSGAWPSLAVLLGAYVLSGVILGLDSFRWSGGTSGHTPLRLAWRALRVILFSASWLPVFTVAWTRLALGGGAVRYAKMAHHGAPEGWRPRAGA